MTTRNFNIGKIKKVVIKIGTSVLADEQSRFSLKILEHITAQVKKLIDSGREVILVSSGAIGCGMSTLGFRRRPKDLASLQACAAIGQGKLMKAYEDFFSRYGFHTAQVLLTRDAFQDRARCLNIKNTLKSLVRFGVIPVINENDTVSTEEIRFGDNDTLSLAVAEVVEADLLVLLSDVDGVYVGGDPSSVITEIETAGQIDELFQHVFSRRKSEMTLGGMSSKLEVAKRAMNGGISIVVMNGKKRDGVTSLFAGECVGSLFIATKSKRGFKESWLTGLTKARGSLKVDGGAHEALVKGGKSLLPSGICEVEGHFVAGDSVHVSTIGGEVFARGIVNYSSDELSKIKGKKTKEIISILGLNHGDEVIHRDNLVMTE